MAKWDYYATTVYGVDPLDLLADLQAYYDLSDICPGRAKHGFQRAAIIRRGETDLVTAWWGGNKGIHLIASGDQAPALKAFLDARPPQYAEGQLVGGLEHRPTRMDAAIDWTGHTDLFDQLAAKLVDFALAKRLKLRQDGDWIRGKGRTLYLGKRGSAVMLRLYEKGAEQAVKGITNVDPTWVRLEVEVRPKGHAKADAALWQPGECFEANWVGTACNFALGREIFQKRAVGTVWKPTDFERSLGWLAYQGGRTLQQLAEQVGWENVGPYLQGLIEAQAAPTPTPPPPSRASLNSQVDQLADSQVVEPPVPDLFTPLQAAQDDAGGGRPGAAPAPGYVPILGDLKRAPTREQAREDDLGVGSDHREREDAPRQGSSRAAPSTTIDRSADLSASSPGGGVSRATARRPQGPGRSAPFTLDDHRPPLHSRPPATPSVAGD